MTKLRVLDLFSGIGGFSLGLERTGGFETVAFCEIDTRLWECLDAHWPDVLKFADIKGLSADAGCVDLICGGFPCQPYSTASAGKRKGANDDRALWPEMRRLVSEAKPRWVVCENVRGIAEMDLKRVVLDLEAIGYEVAPPFEIPACAVGHDHQRARYWIVGHAHGNREPKRSVHDEAPRLRYRGPQLARLGAPNGVSFWMGALGNAVVPQIPEMIGHAILQAEVAQ
jgi:DNA (cytosine-5)-methyltransferase 1